MLSDVRNYYGLARDFGQAGYFETEHSEQIVSELKLEIKAGKLVALSGIVGCGKTTMLRRIQEALSQDKEILASKSLSLEKSQISLAKDFKIPTQPERRERALRDLIKKRQKPIALFIDDAHDLHSKTLIGLKRLIEVIRDSGGMVQAQAAPQTPGNIVPVTAENFPPAESDLYFVAVVKKGGFGKFDHTRELAPIDHQTVIRLNRDTLIGFLISEFEIAEFCHRACNGEWDDAMGHDEAEEQGFHVW